ncbi:MAG: universal stress protein [Flavobacteriaceae bacterium]|nr:universal stress protein [Flavobacteriaceae bacterium]
MQILLPTDFSNNAFNAIKYAFKLFENEKCTFHLLNTYTPIIYDYDFQMNVGGGLGKVRDVIRNNSVDQLEELKLKLEKDYASEGHSIETISSFNTFTDEVKALVDELNIDLIVMGTKGATGLKEVLFGSNTIHIIKKRVCPVMAIPDSYFFEAPKDILFPTDYKIDYTEKQLAILKTIARLHNSTTHILHVQHHRELNELETDNQQKLETHLDTFKKAFYHVQDKEIPVAIDEFQKDHYIQLLLMINNKHSFFENLFFKPVIHQIGFHLTTPFLVIPSKM